MNLQQLLVYDCLIFDGDGTLFDSNGLKFTNIRSAVEFVCNDSAKAKEFADWFIRESGIPREDKIFSKFDRDIGEKILQKYNQLNGATIEQVELVPGAVDFLTALSQAGKKLVLFSAGDGGEVLRILKKHQLEKFFSVILTGAQKTKAELVKAIGSLSAIYFGDALKDFLMAEDLSIPFVYVDGYTLKVMNFSEQVKSPLLSIKNYLEIQGD